MAIDECKRENTRVLDNTKITDEEVKEMHEIFGEGVLPNPEMYPSSFAYYYKLYRVFKYDKSFREWKENVHYWKS